MDHQNSGYLLNNFERNEPTLPRNIFLHFVDHEFLSLTYLHKAPLFEQMRQATAVALLIADNHVYIPASSYFETDYARALFYYFQEFREFGFLRLVGNAFSVGDFLEIKLIQYAKDYGRYPKYRSEREIRKLLTANPNWYRRSGNSAYDIGLGWKRSVNMQEPMWTSLAQRHGLQSSRLERNLLAVPERLGDTSFIAEYVIPLLHLPKPTPRDINEINAFITKQYF